MADDRGQILDGTHAILNYVSEAIRPRGARHARCLAVRLMIYGVRITEDFGCGSVCSRYPSFVIVEATVSFALQRLVRRLVLHDYQHRKAAHPD